MTASIAGWVVDLTYDSVDLQPADRSFVLWVTRGLNDVPSVRGQDVVVPAKVGRVAANRVADVLQIELTGWVMAQSDFDAPAEFRTTVELLKALFDPTSQPRTLSATLEDGSTATIEARAVPPILISETVPSHAAKLSIALESLDPYWVITPAGS